MYIFASESINPMTKPIITIILSFFALSIWAYETIGISDNTDTNITIDETNFPDGVIEDYHG